jgi:CheY-like chemotaxis protein
MSEARILAVDDDPVNLHIIESIFENEAYAIKYARNGSEALAMLAPESVPFDIVLLDRMMPGMDGLEVLRQIKGTPRLAHIPIVMQTGAAAPEQVEDGLRAGARYYLTKPYTPSALLTIVRAAIDDMRRYLELETRSTAQLATMRLASTATFFFRTLDEAADLAALLAALCPVPGSVLMGFSELLVNAVEHGNLGISYRDKSVLKRENRWHDEIQRRLQLGEFRDRRGSVGFERRADELEFRICDQGEGFVWNRYLEFDASRVFDPNGRGIALVKTMSFPTLRYEGRGNVAVATVAVEPVAIRDAAGAHVPPRS